MGLKAQIPRIISEHQSCNLLVGQNRNSVSVLSVGLAGGFGDDILPSVDELRAPRTVGNDKVRLVRLHALEFLVGIGQ